MTQNNNYSVLPWYTNIEEQNHRKSYAYGSIYPLFTPANFLLPFQIIRPHTGANANDFRIYDKNGKDMFGNIIQAMNETGLQLVEFPQYGYDVFVYPGNIPMSLNVFDGVYYASLQTLDGQLYYSEMFTIVQDVSPYLKIEWFDKENLLFDAGIIVYDVPKFKNVLYFCTELGKPEYTYEEEGETRNGYFFPQKQISEKTYKATITAPEYLCDVMRFIRMADYVRVTDKYGRVYNVDTFLITPKWQTQGDLASVEIEFETDTVVKKIGRGFIVRDNGDFNADFNNDFDNE